MSIDIDMHTITGAQAQAIAALLSEPSIKAAALSVDIAPSTLYRWLQTDEAFKAAYRVARVSALEAAIGRLQMASSTAVEALERNLSCGVAGVEVRAALGLLDRAMHGTQVMDLDSMIERFEADEEED